MSARLSIDRCCEVPVALFIFNRADLTAQVVAAIRDARPRRLLVVADGPRQEAERARCEAARNAVVVDWPCEVETLYAESNLGCRRRVASGIEWVFERSERAIILEDDCLPSRTFFPFCETLLDRYAEDDRVMCIGGLNLYPRNRARAGESYYFSRYGATNGWATWRRAWRCFDVSMGEWPAFRRSGAMRDLFVSREERWFWTQLFDAQFEGRIDTWDYQWLFARLVAGGLTAAPWTNMVANLGFRADATHSTRMPAVWNPARHRGDINQLEHPRHVLPNRDVDDYYFHDIFNPYGVPGVAFNSARATFERLRRAVGAARDRR